MKVLYSKLGSVRNTGDITDQLLSTGSVTECTDHQLIILSDVVPSGGAVTVKYQAKDSNRWHTLKDSNGNTVSLTLTGDDTISISGVVLDAVKITMTGFAGAAYWQPILKGW